MKQKGITVIEQHVEKLVLLAAVAIALFFGVIQFLGDGNTSDFNGKSVPAVRLDKELETQATNIQGDLSNDAPSTFKAPDRGSASVDFKKKLQGAISPNNYASPPRYAIVPATGLSADGDKEYMVPKLHAVSRPMVDQHVDALHEDVVAALSEEHGDFLNDIFGALPETYDVSWATPHIAVDWKAIRDQLRADDPSGEKLGIPVHWYRDRIFVLNLHIEREAYLRDGTWGDKTTLESLPLMSSLNEYIEKEDLPTFEKDNALTWLEEQINQASIIQPEFYATKGDYWSFPVLPVDRDEDAGAEMQGIFDLQDEIARIDGRLSQYRARLEQLEGREDEKGAGGGSGGSLDPGGGGGGGGAGGGGLNPGGGNSGGDGSNRLRGIQKTIENLKKKIEKQEKILESKQEALEQLAMELGIDLDEEVEAHALIDLEKDDVSLVWGHDITVVPGETYRYRITVQVYNPFFGKEPVLVEAQKDLAKALVIDVQRSEWSEPIRIKERTRFFVTRAIPESANNQNVGKATVEVYHIYDGSWFLKKYEVVPGDPIGQTEKVSKQEEDFDIDYSTNFFVLDILKRPGDRSSSSGQMKGSGKVVIAMPSGETILRDPDKDTKDRERLELQDYSDQG